jgi:pimeloyl-ACP methyl ester carboxylesterase
MARRVHPGTAAIGGLAGVLSVAGYPRQRRRALQRLKANSQIVETKCGPIEYGGSSKGAADHKHPTWKPVHAGAPTVLVSHGTMGGYDEGLAITQLLTKSFNVLSPSRAGYLRSPLSTGPTPEDQADAYAALLDTLNIDTVALLAISGGGPSALQFALRHPDRCHAVIMLCAVSHEYKLTHIEDLLVANLIYRFKDSDLLTWIGIRAVIGAIPIAHKIDAHVRRLLTDDSVKVRLFKALMESYFPMTLRKPGIKHDFTLMEKLPDYPLRQIRCPTLALHAVHDNLVPFTHAENVAKNVPGAELVSLDDGADHGLFITHKDIVWPRIETFLNAHVEVG